jgi:SNF2 family DNA or RNA helicase
MEKLKADTHRAGLLDEYESQTGTMEPLDLFPYQLSGVSWMKRREKEGSGGVLADDMGLGKTLQCLTIMALNPKPTLVLCSGKVKESWKDDIDSKFEKDTFNLIDWHEKKEAIPKDKDGIV